MDVSDDYDYEDEFKRLLLKLPTVKACSHCGKKVFEVYYMPIPKKDGSYTVTDALCDDCSGMSIVRRSNERRWFPEPRPVLVP